MNDQEKKIIAALAFFGESADRYGDTDTCENGSVYLGLTQILPPGSVDPIAEIRDAEHKNNPWTHADQETKDFHIRRITH